MRNEKKHNLILDRFIRAFVICIGSFFGTLLLTGCSAPWSKGADTEHVREYSVVIQQSDFFDADIQSAKVSEGGNFTAELEFVVGYSFESCNYEDVVIETEGNKAKLTLSNISHDYRIVIKSSGKLSETTYPEKTVTITYHTNMGETDTVFTEKYTLSYHFRANTSIGENLSRYGYTLLGWNTKADGSGEHIGLGSRTDATELYAEWIAWEASSNFVVKRTDEGIILTGYKGKDVDTLVIPEEIDGRKVVSISSSFTSNMPCGKLTGSTLVLPKSIVKLENGSFRNSSFTEMYFYDSLEEVEQGTFPNPMSTYHINAALAPCFQVDSDNARFADKMDYLMLQEGKRLVLFAGCSASYGLKSELLQSEFTDYSVCNMGVIGGINAIFQMQIIINFLREGDVFVHLPEEMSAFQLMAHVSVDYRCFVLVEGNYDLLTYADFSNTEVFWEGYNSYRKNKADQTAGSYSDATITYNKYGDIIFGRPYDEENAWELDESRSDGTYVFDLDVITEAGIERLCSFYDQLKAKGVQVYVSYAPINENGLDGVVSTEEFEQAFCRALAKYGYTTIGKLSDHIFKGRYFYDSDYHLNDYGAILHTKRLTEELKSAMK